MIFGKIKRIWWQITGVILFNVPFIGPNHFAFLPIPVLNCYACPLAQGACPIGTIQHFFVIGAIPFIAIGALGIFGIMAGRFYCGHLCPFGFFQDLIGRISRKKYRLPHWVGYGKYVSLVLLVIILPPILKEPFFCTLCPAGSLEAGIPIVTGAWIQSEFGTADIFGSSFGILSMVGWWFWLKIGILGGLIALTVVSRRPFCRTACPLGAILGLFNRISVFIHPPAEKEKSGKPYRLKECPVHITHPKDVDSHNCIKCRDCVSS
jgi:ferredoxin-type protein NapH